MKTDLKIHDKEEEVIWVKFIKGYFNTYLFN